MFARRSDILCVNTYLHLNEPNYHKDFRKLYLIFIIVGALEFEAPIFLCYDNNSVVI